MINRRATTVATKVLTSFNDCSSINVLKQWRGFMLTQGEAQYAIDELEKAIVEAQHKLANQANREYVKRLKREMVEMLVKVK